MDLKDGNMLTKDAEAQYLCRKDWLAGDSSYQTFVESLSASDPRLRSRDPKAVAQKIPWRDIGRVVSLEVGSDNSFGSATEFRSSSSLQDHFVKTCKLQGRRALYILENAGPGFIGVLGDHFSLHPSVFIDHERVVVMNQKAQGESDGVPLPSIIEGRGHITLKYFEPLQFSCRPTSFRWVCGETGRHIGVSRADDKFLDVAVVRRKCTMWTRTTERGGWDCLLICDPGVKSVRTGEDYRDYYGVTTLPYQGGYVDFVPQHAQVRSGLERSGPPRTSFLDDLVFYLQEHAADILAKPADLESDSMADPDIVVGTFVRKIVTSHYFKLAEHLRATLSASQRALSRKHDLALLPMEKVEELWSDIQAWERRVGEYCEDLEAIMFQLGIPLEDPNTSSGRRLYLPSISPQASLPGTPAFNKSVLSLGAGLGGFSAQRNGRCQWLDPTLDFQFLLLRFRELRHRTECLNSAVTGLASITGNRQTYKEQQLALETARRSIREAKSSKAVTLLGLIFIPLAYMSSIFSMQEPYGPGGQKFWQYFVASVPLIVVVIVAYYVLDFGYNDEATSWSLPVFTATVSEKLKKLQRQDVREEDTAKKQ